MDMLIEDLAPCRIAYIRQVGPYGNDNVQTMEKLKSWAAVENLFNEDAIILGIARDNPETTKPEDCRYDTCIVLSGDYVFNDVRVSEGNIIGGKYAVFRINHTAEAVRKAWADIFPELYIKGFQFDETRPILERYKVSLVNMHFCEICVPVKKGDS